MQRFFIIGNPRSGTTLLRLMLNKHSIISVPPEAGFLSWLYKTYSDFTFSEKHVSQFLDALKETKKIENWNLNFLKLKEYILLEKPNTYAELCDIIYKYYSKFNLKKEVQVFGDKNNFYLNEVSMLSKLYPNSKFIHIIRDGRSVAVSYQDLHKKQISVNHAPNLPVDIEEIAQDWKTNITKINLSFENLDPKLHFTIRFEDLVLEPIRSLKSLALFLNIDYEDNMLKYYETTEEDGLEPKNFLEWKKKNLQPIQEDEAVKYMKLSKEDREKFEKITKHLLENFNYLRK